ncbi:unnamed protein product, partial [Vitrella brassicaformis CCMP3155]
GGPPPSRGMRVGGSVVAPSSAEQSPPSKVAARHAQW